VKSEADNTKCDFCGKVYAQPAAISIDRVSQFIEESLSDLYDDPVQWLAWESAEGGWQGATVWRTFELLRHAGPVLPNDPDDRLFQAISDSIGATREWCRINPYGPSADGELGFAWRSFCERVKHQDRYFFVAKQQDNREHIGHPADPRADDIPEGYEADDEEPPLPSHPLEMLQFIEASCVERGLYRWIRPGHRFYRCRVQRTGELHETAAALGPPPRNRALQSNRMTPSGIVGFYVCDRRATAAHETANASARLAAGEFVNLRRLRVLDISRLTTALGVFSSATPMQKQVGLFLEDVLTDLASPIARDELVHIDYVPTQVFCEYFRTQATNGGAPLHGISYPSAAGSGNSYCFFMDQLDLQHDDVSLAALEEPEKSRRVYEPRDPSFRLSAATQLEIFEWGLWQRRVRQVSQRMA
jgi:hypothetical protein